MFVVHLLVTALSLNSCLYQAPGIGGRAIAARRSVFARPARHALKMLTTAMDLGETLIITNAMTGWVEQSASRWAPSLLPLLRKVQTGCALGE